MSSMSGDTNSNALHCHQQGADEQHGEVSAGKDDHRRPACMLSFLDWALQSADMNFRGTCHETFPARTAITVWQTVIKSES
jgi:hypothetical protein